MGDASACVVGGVDPATGDTIANCPPVPPCMPVGSMGPLAPSQVWCDSGTQLPSSNDAAPFISINGAPAPQPQTVSPWVVGVGVFALGLFVFRSGK